VRDLLDLVRDPATAAPIGVTMPDVCSEPAPDRHVLILPYPSAGHVTPTLAVARELIARGHRVTYAVTGTVAASAASTGADVIEYDTALMSTVKPPAIWADDEMGRAFLRYVSEIIGTTAAIERQLGDARPDLIAYDSTVWAPGRVLGRKWSVPVCQLLPVFASNESFSLMRAQVERAGHPELAEDHPAILAFKDMLAEFLAGNGIDPGEADAITAGKGERSLVFLPKSFQPCGETFGDDHAFVGPCHTESTGEPSWTPPDNDKPVVFVSLGTVVNDQPGFFATCAEALRGQGWHVVLAVGDSLEEESIAALPAEFEVHRWLPYGEVLPHADVFVSQAGMGSIMRAGEHATPLVVVPFQPEQRINAERVTELGLGRRIDPAGLTAANLREAIAAVTTDATVRKGLKALREDIEAAGGAARAAGFLEESLPGEAIELPRKRSCPFDPPDGYREGGAIRRLRFPLGGEGWLVTGYAEAKAVLSDSRFSHRSELLASPLPPPFPLPPGKHTPPAAEPGAFNKMDPPEHTFYRRVVGHYFSPRKAVELRPEIEKATAELLDHLDAQGPPADLVRDFARPLPARLIFDLLGVPEEIRGPLHENLDVIMRLRMTMDELIDSVRTVGDLLDGFVAAGPEQGALGELAARGELGNTELRNIAWALLGGGTDTTANMIALGVLAILEHPRQRETLKQKPDLLDNAIEELLRYLTISQFGASRSATEDITVGGTRVRAGETVVVALPAANRDPGKFAGPDAFDITRNTRGHLAFGHGVHKCIGQYLARETLRVAYPALLDRFPGLRLAVSPRELRMRDDMDHYGVHELPVTW
jgi:MGT family glycosyltransferase